VSGKPLVLIISPASAKANNGNWQTASRWAGFLEDDCQVQILNQWTGQPGADLMIALHARRSAPSIDAWRRHAPHAPLVVVLTGTDLYRDIRHDEHARRSLHQANRLVVLQEAALSELTAPDLPPVQVIYQSAPRPAPAAHRPAKSPFITIMIGHLRPEKKPETYMQAAGLLASPDLLMLHVGAALDAQLGALARQTAASCPHYQWLDTLPHQQTLAQLTQCDLMVLSSAMEGGANVIIEAVVAGVPVLASDIAGNRGMLGADYGGYFPVGDARALAALIARAQCDPAFLGGLKRQCQARAPLFSPARERTLVCELVDNVCRLPTRPK
jgi:putative glycosyltransferase (TIGR04348 family)